MIDIHSLTHQSLTCTTPDTSPTTKISANPYEQTWGRERWLLLYFLSSHVTVITRVEWAQNAVRHDGTWLHSVLVGSALSSLRLGPPGTICLASHQTHQAASQRTQMEEVWLNWMFVLNYVHSSAHKTTKLSHYLYFQLFYTQKNIEKILPWRNHGCWHEWRHDS